MQFINPAGLHDPAPNGYSHVAIAESPELIVYLAGQGGEDANGVLSESFQAQVRQALANLKIALDAAGAQLTDIAKLTVLIVDHSEERLRILSDEVRAAWGNAPTPACTLIPVTRLALDGMLFEIDATVVISSVHS